MNWSQWIDSGEWRSSIEVGMPMPPALATDVMPLVVDPDVSVLRVARVIAKDQVLTTRVLRLANSAACAPMHEVTTINDAIVRLGTAAVREAVFVVCFASKLQTGDAYGPRGRELADHGVGTAYLARLVAEHAGVDSDEVFIPGLLHDIGKLVLLKLARDFTRSGGVLPPAAELDEGIAARHAAIGAEILRGWQLPERIIEPVLHHHDPAGAANHQREADVVYAANRLSHRYGFGCAASLPDDDGLLLSDPVSERLQLSPEWLTQTDTRAPGLFELARQVLG